MDLFKDSVYEYMKNKIITCEWKPNEIIDQNILIKELGVSRTPIRDAITALSQENLVVILPRRGVLVANITHNDISTICITRELVEPYIARITTPIADKEKLLEFKKLFNSNKVKDEDMEWNDFNFHKYLVGISNNKYLISMMDNILSHNMRFVTMAASIPNRLRASNEEHVEIIDAMLNGDADAAEQKMRSHLIKARESSFQSLSNVGIQ